MQFPPLARVAAAATALALVPFAADAARFFNLDASNIEFDIPAPLFTTSTVTGSFALDDSIAPGAGFNLGAITDFSFNFGGLAVTLADTQLAGATITAFGTLSADGAAISALDLRFDLPTTVAFCSFICAGQIQIAIFDRSNFVAINDDNAETLSLVQFDARLNAVPEPASAALFGLAMLGLAAQRRKRPD